jgi:hypothetical protein
METKKVKPKEIGKFNAPLEPIIKPKQPKK